MANIKISELEELLTINSNDILPIVDTTNNETKKIKQKNLLPVDDTMKNNSENPVQNKVIKQYVDEETGKKVDKVSIKNQKSTSTSDIYSCDYANRKVATASLSAGVDNIVKTNIPFDVITSNTDKLTLVSHGIKIGSGISKIMVSANAFFMSEETSGYLWTYIYRNNPTINEAVSVALNNPVSYFCSISHAPRLINVVEGDIITLWKQDNETGTIRGKENTYLTVEVIE